MRCRRSSGRGATCSPRPGPSNSAARADSDRKSTRLNSSHSQISYAVFCLKKNRQEQAVDLLEPDPALAMRAAVEGLPRLNSGAREIAVRHIRYLAVRQVLERAQVGAAAF